MRKSLDVPTQDFRANAASPSRRYAGPSLKILFAVASWGLGHATRDLPLIHRLLDDGHTITVVSSDRALGLLKQELGQRCEFLEWPDMPLTLAKSAPLSYAKFTLSLPLALRAIIAEHVALDRLLRRHQFDRVISDNRFGIRTSKVTSFQLAHGLRFIAPRRTAIVELFMEYIYYRCFGPVTQLVVPDFADDGLSGELSHNLRLLESHRINYVGILSGIRRLEVEEDLDCYVSISGPEPQRSIFEDITLRQVYDIPGRVVVSLGKPEEAGRSWNNGRATIYAYVNRHQQQMLMNRARMVVSRSGYTTMMELAELGKPALYIPTPGQTEQEYLASYHRQLGSYYSVPQARLDLPRDLAIARAYRGYQPAHRTEVSIERFVDLVASS